MLNMACNGETKEALYIGNNNNKDMVLHTFIIDSVTHKAGSVDWAWWRGGRGRELISHLLPFPLMFLQVSIYDLVSL